MTLKQGQVREIADYTNPLSCDTRSWFKREHATLMGCVHVCFMDKICRQVHREVLWNMCAPEGLRLI